MTAIAFILFVTSNSAMPDLTALAVYATKEACEAAAEQVKSALKTGEDGKPVFCISSDSLTEMAQKNGLDG
jgi:hypothetical protein